MLSLELQITNKYWNHSIELYLGRKCLEFHPMNFLLDPKISLSLTFLSSGITVLGRSSVGRSRSPQRKEINFDGTTPSTSNTAISFDWKNAPKNTVAYFLLSSTATLGETCVLTEFIYRIGTRFSGLTKCRFTFGVGKSGSFCQNKLLKKEFEQLSTNSQTPCPNHFSPPTALTPLIPVLIFWVYSSWYLNSR